MPWQTLFLNFEETEPHVLKKQKARTITMANAISLSLSTFKRLLLTLSRNVHANNRVIDFSNHLIHTVKIILVTLPKITARHNIVGIIWWFIMGLFVQGVITSLFPKLPWSGDSKGTFRSLSQVATCLPHAVEASRSSFLLLNVKQGSCEYQFLYFLV